MRPRLEFQADRIEKVLSLHKVPARVIGGTVTPRWVRFRVTPAVGAKISKIKGLSEELAAALDTSQCRISRSGATVTIEAARNDPQPVRLLPLYKQLTDPANKYPIPPATAILGLAQDGAPLLIRLTAPDAGHILVAGDASAGKSALLQTIILSLAILNPYPTTNQYERELAFVLIGTKRTTFGALADLPHLARPVIHEVAEATETLASLRRLMDSHPSNESGSRATMHPRIVVVIDDLENLLDGHLRPMADLVALTEKGGEVGIHIVAATSEQKVHSGFFHQERSVPADILIQCDFPVLLVGKTNDRRAASDWGVAQAAHLRGRGDFLCVAEDKVRHFHAAYISLTEIQASVNSLAQQTNTPISNLPPKVIGALTQPLTASDVQ